MNLQTLSHSARDILRKPTNPRSARRAVAQRARGKVDALDLHVNLILEADAPFAHPLHLLERPNSLIVELERRYSPCRRMRVSMRRFLQARTHTDAVDRGHLVQSLEFGALLRLPCERAAEVQRRASDSAAQVHPRPSWICPVSRNSLMTIWIFSPTCTGSGGEPSHCRCGETRSPCAAP